MSAVLGALASAGVGLASGIFSGIGANKRQKRAIQAQKEENERAREWSHNEAVYQNQVARENVENERAYNSPSAVMQRLKDAGLNPDLMYGNGASGLVDGNVAQSAGANSVPPANVGDIIAGTPTMAESLMTGAAYAKTIAETQNIKADTVKKEGEVQSLDIDNFIKSATKSDVIKLTNLDVQLTKSQAEYTDAQKSKIISEINQINENIGLIQANVSESLAKVRNLDASTLATRTGAILNNKRFDLECQEFIRRCKETDAKVTLDATTAKSILVTMYANLNNINADTALKQAHITLSDAQKAQVEEYTSVLNVQRDAASFNLSQDQKFDTVERISVVANQATQSIKNISDVVSDWLPSPGGIAKKLFKSSKR